MPRFNLRLLFFHLLATLCILFGIANLLALMDVETIFNVRKFSGKDFNQILRHPPPELKPLNVSDIVNLELHFQLFPVIGQLTGVLLSLFICLKKKWPWYTPIVIFLLSTMILKSYNGIDTPGPWKLYPAIFSGKLYLDLAITGTILTTAGLYLFFSASINKSIANTISVANLQHGKTIL